MNENELTLRFTGVADIKPQAVRASELAEIITAFEAAITNTVIARDPALKREQLVVPLVALTDQSIGLVFAPNLPDLTLAAATRIAEAIVHNNFTTLPIATLKPLRTLLWFVRAYRCIAELRVVRANQVQVAALTPETQIQAASTLRGETVLYGEVVRVGGVEPKVEIRTLQGKTLFCPTTTAIAVQLAGRLYQQVGVYGEAEWNVETLEIEEFSIQQVSPYGKIPLHQAFTQLRESANSVYDAQEDVSAYMTAVRYEE